MRVLDLFSGIGGFSLGLERAGMKTVGFCEIEPFCRAVLAKHWPGVPCHDDITTRGFTEGEADVICGGFPCQDISNAGKRAGITGERSGLWRELVRAVRVVRPKYAIVENVAALLADGMGAVCGDLAESGHDAEWDCVPACAVGAPHRRDRVWIVAYPASDRCGSRLTGRPDTGTSRKSEQALQDASNAASVFRLAFKWKQSNGIVSSHWRLSWAEYLETIRGMDDGVSGRVDGLAALGNAVVPQIPELIGRAIMAADATRG